MSNEPLPSRAEIAAVKRSIEVANQPGAKTYTHEEVMRGAADLIAGKKVADYDPAAEADDWQM